MSISPEKEEIIFLQILTRFLQNTHIDLTIDGWVIDSDSVRKTFFREMLLSLQLKQQILSKWDSILTRLHPNYITVITNRRNSSSIKIAISRQQLCTTIRERLFQVVYSPSDFQKIEEIFLKLGCQKSDRILQEII